MGPNAKKLTKKNSIYRDAIKLWSPISHFFVAFLSSTIQLMFSVVDTSPYSWYKFSRNEKNVPICLEILWRHSCSPVSADQNMNNNSTEGDFSVNEFFADLLANNNNRTEIKNHTFQNFFSSECGNIPDVERIQVRDNI